MRWVPRLRSLPVRGKVLLTVTGAALLSLGVSTSLSFRYWEREAAAAARRQALLAAAATQATVESAVRLGRDVAAHDALERLRREGGVTRARIHGPDGHILVSTDRSEEGERPGPLFMPDARTLPRSGLVRDAETGVARAYLPVSLPQPGILEVEFSVAEILASVRRGARLGLTLTAVSLLAVTGIVVTMFEREVVRPIRRLDVLLRGGPGGPVPGPGDEILGLERSVVELLEKERAVEARAVEGERRLEAREGLAQVGELATEMAHEFKRPLASIRTALDVLDQEYELNGTGRDVLGAVHGQLERVQDTMRDLFSLARPLVLEARPVDVATTLDEALAELVGHPAMAGVTVRRSYSPDLPRVAGDARRLRQAFQNLVVNGAEAMGGRGTLTLACAGAAGGAVEVSISDAGPGLDPEEAERALRPFYSTKPSGTGLGLPLVARIVSAHRGGLAFESGAGRGTTVRVTLPGAAPEGGERS